MRADHAEEPSAVARTARVVIIAGGIGIVIVGVVGGMLLFRASSQQACDRAIETANQLMMRGEFDLALSEADSAVRLANEPPQRARALIARARANALLSLESHRLAIAGLDVRSATRTAWLRTQAELDVTEAAKLDPSTKADGDALLATWKPKSPP